MRRQRGDVAAGEADAPSVGRKQAGDLVDQRGLTGTVGADNGMQLAAYVIAGMMAGLSGFLLANATEFVSPAYMSWQRSGDLIIMVILGGLGSLHGAIIGAGAYLLLEEWLSAFTEDWKVIFGPFLVLVVLFARGGLLGMGKGLVRRLSRG